MFEWNEPDEPTPTWDLGTAALRGAACWSEVYLPEPLWGEYAIAAAGVNNPSEVYIALAIREGIAGATDAFEVMYFGVIERALVRASATTSEIAELVKLMREWLFAPGRGEHSMIATYAGQGQLPRLLRGAVLEALSALRGNLKG